MRTRPARPGGGEGQLALAESEQVVAVDGEPDLRVGPRVLGDVVESVLGERAEERHVEIRHVTAQGAIDCVFAAQLGIDFGKPVD